MDLGCGSAVLSIFAARAGAGHVIAIEANPRCAAVARRVVSANGLSRKITVICGQIEKITAEVDAQIEKHGGKLAVLVSEWMGAGLVHEGMFNSVIFARDRWKPREMVPRSCVVRAVPVTHPAFPDEATSVGFWREPHYGID